MKNQAQMLFAVQNILGEGPLWHPTEQHLYWVDIDRMALYRSHKDLSGFTHTQFNTKIGAFGFRKDTGFILATSDGFANCDTLESTPEVLWNPLPNRHGVRLNDGKVDPQGRFWAGSIDKDQSCGALYRLDPDHSQHTLLQHIGISNGIDWSPDQKIMYYTDSMQSTIFVFDFNPETGAIHHQRPFIQTPKDHRDIVPDGLCVDAEGCIWSAQWNGWQVIRYNPQGKPIQHVKVPAQHVTSCCFGGKNMSQLFITTARSGFADKDLAGQPHAGDVFIYETDTQGQAANFFGLTQQ